MYWSPRQIALDKKHSLRGTSEEILHKTVTEGGIDSVEYKWKTQNRYLRK